MLEDKLRATDWEATNEVIEEQVARESYLQWFKDNERHKRSMVNNMILQTDDYRRVSNHFWAPQFIILTVLYSYFLEKNHENALLLKSIYWF